MKKKILIVVLLIIAGWLVYFDITSYISYVKTKNEYEIVLKKYQSTKNELDYIQQTMKELQSQIANGSNHSP
jgi:peptidoglycan hydrolase CwlO-like protein